MSLLVWWKVHAAFLHFSFLFLGFLEEVKREGPKKERGLDSHFLLDSGCIDELIYYYIVIVITIVITLTF